MLTIFNNIAVKEFHSYFDSESKCLQILAEEKWKDGFVCRFCGHLHYCEGKKPFSRRCTRCKKEESATAHTIFHHCKIALPDAFRLVYAVCNTPTVSTLELSEQLNMRQMTCWKFKKKVMSCIDARKDVSEQGKVELKQIILGIDELSQG